MKRGQEIKGADNVTYTVISQKGDRTLLSYETENGSHFIVARSVLPSGDGPFYWSYSLDFGADLHRATRFLTEQGPTRRRLKT